MALNTAAKAIEKKMNVSTTDDTNVLTSGAFHHQKLHKDVRGNHDDSHGDNAGKKSCHFVYSVLTRVRHLAHASCGDKGT